MAGRELTDQPAAAAAGALGESSWQVLAAAASGHAKLPPQRLLAGRPTDCGLLPRLLASPSSTSTATRSLLSLPSLLGMMLLLPALPLPCRSAPAARSAAAVPTAAAGSTAASPLRRCNRRPSWWLLLSCRSEAAVGRAADRLLETATGGRCARCAKTQAVLSMAASKARRVLSNRQSKRGTRAGRVFLRPPCSTLARLTTHHAALPAACTYL